MHFLLSLNCCCYIASIFITTVCLRHALGRSLVFAHDYGLGRCLVFAPRRALDRVLLFAHHLLWIILCLARVLFGPCCLPEMIHLLFHFTHRSVGACLFIPFGRLGLPLTFVLVCGPFWSDISLVYSLILLACLRHHDFLGGCIPLHSFILHALYLASLGS